MINSTSPDKLPPQNIDAERSLLGSLLIDKESINKVADILHPEDFYSRPHQLIFDAVFELFEKREPIDILSLSNKLRDMKCLEDVGGISYLTSLASMVPTSAHVAAYAKIIQRKKMLRDLIAAAHHMIGLGYREDDEVENLLDEAEKKLFAVSQRSMSKTFLRLGTTLDEAMDRIINQTDGTLRGLKTNYSSLDNKLGGLQKSDLIVLAARPSVGKTAFAINLALNVAKSNIPVGIFSMEMSTDQIVDRLISAQSGVSLWKLRTGKLGNDLQRTTQACEELKSMPVFIDDSPSPNILQMRAMARRLQAEHKDLGLLVVDYLQLMTSRRNYDSAVQQVTEISRGLKGLAKELNIPIIAISQLSRAVEQREGHKPRLSDLRDSGSIEQDADLVMFIHREDKIKDRDRLDESEKNKASLIIAKHRNGPTGEIDFRIDPESLIFREEDRVYGDLALEDIPQSPFSGVNNGEETNFF
jgi:replicative DNA helicase